MVSRDSSSIENPELYPPTVPGSYNFILQVKRR
jgi:hypothetical protein